MDMENQSNNKKKKQTRYFEQCLGMFITTLLRIMECIHVETNKSYVRYIKETTYPTTSRSV